MDTKLETTFRAMWDAEREVRVMSTIAAFRGAGVPDYVAARQDESLGAAQAKLGAMLDGLTPEQGKAYGGYRAAMLAETSSPTERNLTA